MPTIDFSNPAYTMAPVLPAAQGNSNGNQPSQIDFSKYMTGANASSNQQPVLPPASTFGGEISKAGSDIASTITNIPKIGSQDIPNPQKPTLPQEMQAGADVGGELAGGVSKVVGDVVGAAGSAIPVSEENPDVGNPSLPPLKMTNGSEPTNLTDAFTAMMQGLGKTAPAGYISQKINDFQTKHPLAAKDLGDFINVASITPGEGAAEDISEGAVNAGKNVAKAVSDTGETIDKAKIAASSGTRIPTLKSAASRVSEKSVLPKATEAAEEMVPMKQGIGNKSTVADPASLHAKYYAQEVKALGDTKEDTALGMVGSDLGKSFENVVKIRQNAGKKMASELEKFGSKKVSASGIVSAFQKELIDSGAKYDALTQTVKNTADSKFSTTDTKLLEKYGQEISKLGKNPSAKSLDAFVGRMPNEIKELKATAGINFKTNAERIIGKNLDSVRDTLTSAGTKEYKTARSSYSSLSNFVNEGIPFLGKKTSTGDFAKDASLVKSSVQSALNGGKKDWLMKLESLTGDPIIDKATLALQAMKDAGDYRGASLLQTLTEGASNGKLPEIPTSLTGMTNALAGKALKKGAEKFIGTPYEQTQRYLKSLSKKK